MKKTKLIIIFSLIFALTGIKAQQGFTAAGGGASGGGGTAAYSVGQIVYTTNTGAGGSVAQGVQQPYEISIVLGVEDHQISLNMKVYPNPTSDFLILNVGNFELSTLNFELYDISGKLLERKKITSSTETISLVNLPSSTYFLKVTSNNEEIKTFKVIKNQ
jgi:hypothetical protein